MREVLKLLDELAAGTVADELESALGDVIHAVRTLERKGTIALKLEFEPDDRSPDGIVIRADVNAKPPKPAARPSIFYRTHDGRLSRFDPRQKQIPGLQRVDDPESPPERVDPDTGEVIQA